MWVANGVQNVLYVCVLYFLYLKCHHCLNASIITIVMPSINGVTKYIGGLKMFCFISLKEAKRSVQHTIHKITLKTCTKNGKV